MTFESSGSGSSDHEEPLSATAMFLRSLEEPSAAPKQEAGWAAPPVKQEQAAPAAGGQGPGEFTRMFQTVPRQEAQAPQASAPATPVANPVPSAAPAPAANAGASGGQGEFTRIFSAGSVSQEAKTVIEPPPYAPPVAPPAGGSSRKGFSTPGISDSASGGSVTQLFKPVAASAPPPAVAPAPVAAAPVNAPAQPIVPSPAYVPAAEPAWKPEANFPAHGQPAAGPSVTSLLSTLAAPGSSSPARAPEPVPYSPAPVPAYTPQHQGPSATPEAGSVTQLIQRLAQTPAEPPPPLPVAPAAPVAPASSGPGEFTRMISAAAFAPAVTPAPAAAPTPPPAAAAPAFPAMPPVAMPHVAAPQMPHAQAGPAPQAHLPHMQAAPPMQMPKPPALPPVPAMAAPKGKLEGMVPILLIVNTFLLVLVLVVVLFALKAH
ncbi:MAG TPA: hypothetical protein VL346_12485 [Acidobacteriaceae bacterium]|nr:hypothetical protein [Acidobacteriaceae bacterium]